MTVIDVSREDVGRRAGPDVARHRALSQRAIRDQLKRKVADLSIITMGSKNKKVTLQVPVLREYRFEYSHRYPGCGAGGDGKRGDVIQDEQVQQPGPGSGSGGDAPTYEITVDQDEIAEFLFEDLKLPNFLRKQLRQTVIIDTGGRVGSNRQGPMSKINRRATMREWSRRMAGLDREGVVDDDEEGFIDEDLRFHRPSQRPREISNGVCILMMDVSGSMGWRQKYLCRAFFWLLVQFVRSKYEQVEVEFIIHHSDARIVTEDQFFHTTEAGGTMCSTAYELALDLVTNKYRPDEWNIYAFHMSDGDNWENDNEEACSLIRHLAAKCNLVGYGQVSGWYEDEFNISNISWSQLFDKLEPVAAAYPNVQLVRVCKELDVYPQFRQMLEGDKAKGQKP